MDKTNQVPVYDSARQGSAAQEKLFAIFKYRFLLVQFVHRDLLNRYKRSALGVAWTMLNPLGTMIIHTIAFSRAFGGSQEVMLSIC